MTPSSPVPGADSITVPYADILAPHVGPLSDIVVRPVDDGYVWRGTDREGRRQSGTMRSDVRVRDNHETLVIGWVVDVDDPSGPPPARRPTP